MSSRILERNYGSLAGCLADFVNASRLDDLPHEIRLISRQHLLDTVGCCLAAVRLDSSRSLARYLLADGGEGQATAIGVRRRLPAAQAAFMNGLLARSLEFDDMAMPDLHPSGSIVPIVLALCEWCGAPGRDLLSAIAIGLELCLRLGRAGVDQATRMSRFLQRGQDATAICGCIAGAAVAARLLGLDSSGIANAIGIAVSFASGSLEGNRSGGTIKRFQSGWASKSAIQAAMLAKYGVEGPTQALEGRYGFYHCFVDGQFDETSLVEGLGHTWQISDLRFKPYPSNYYTHTGIDAALALRKKGLRVDEIVSAELAVATSMLHTVGEPLDRKQAPKSTYEAKFSAPYAVASALIGGSGLGLGINDFSDEMLGDPARRTLMRKVSVIAAARCDSIFPDQAPSILSVRTANGKTLIEEAMINRGSAGRPLSDHELSTKFSENCAGGLAPSRVDALRELIDRIEEADDLSEIVRIFEAVSG